MGERINEILKKLKPKEKIAIIVSMSALALILVGLILIFKYCGKDETPKHIHAFDYALDMGEDDKFTFTRKCTAEGCDQPLYVEQDVKPTVESVTDSTCGKMGETVYAYSYGDGVAKYIEYAPITGKHTLNGKPIEELLNSDGSINEEIPGVSFGSNVEYEHICGNIQIGHYRCESCEELVSVNVVLGHHGAPVINVAPTCDTPGEQQLKCQFCHLNLEQPEAMEPLGHAYSFTLQQSGSVSNLVGTCTRSGCTDPDYFEANVTDLQEISRTQATCATPETITYKYKNKNGQTVEVTVIGETVNHTLNGVDYTTLANEDGTFNHTIPGIKLFSGKSLCVLPEGGGANGYFVCEVCEQIKDVIIPVTGHDMKLDYSTVQKPTFTSKGYIHYACKNDNCSVFLRFDLPVVSIGTNAEVISQNTANNTVTVKYTHTADFSQVVELTIELSLDHDHDYVYSLEQDGDKTNLVGLCTVSGCLNPYYLAEGITNVTKTGKETPATCASGKLVEYICVANGKQVTFSLVEGEPTKDHVLDGVVAEGTVIVQVAGQTVKAYEYGTEGIKLFSGQEITAGKTVRGYFKCEECEELVEVYVFIPADYQP